MISPLTARATRDAALLAAHYTRLERYEAIRNLADAIETARTQIPNIKTHRPTPGPYPHIARAGTAWVKIGRYWFAYGTKPPRAIRAVIYDTANLPARS